MGRSEAKKTNEQALDTSTTFKQRTDADMAALKPYLDTYNQRLNDYLANDPYTSAEHKASERRLAGDVSSGTAASTKEELTNYATRTGTGGSPQYAAAAEEMDRARSRDLTSFLTQQDLADIEASEKRKQFGIGASTYPVDVYRGIYGTDVSGTTAPLGAAAQSSRLPGFWDTFAPALVAGASKVGAAAVGGKG